MCLWACRTAQCAAGLRATGSCGALLSRLELHRGPVASGVPKRGLQQKRSSVEPGGMQTRGRKIETASIEVGMVWD